MSSDSGRFAREKEIFQVAHELLAEARAVFLAEACGEDADLRRGVESLLKAAQAADGGLDTGVWAAALVEEDLEPEEAELAPGQRVGRWAIVRTLGRGGMGVVYLADRADREVEGRAALKLVRHGLDTEVVRQRFRRERQILAGLDHPNIARLLDAGTTEDGRPYFVMEHVEGEHLLAWCDARRLPIPERLRLFEQICSAVAYAHRHLVVHRDLKPGNILVTTDGTPKLLDFGLARLVEADEGERAGEPTVALLRIFTPEYASPEQLLGERVTTASDLYSLGVVLYELVCGRGPYRLTVGSLAELAHAVSAQEAERPSAALTRTQIPSAGEPPLSPEEIARRRGGDLRRLRRALRGDLDAIVLHALRKEPHQRYPSVEQLAEDLARHRQHLPLRARRGSLAERSLRFTRRHRAGAAATALATLALLAGLGVALWQARVARAERTRAERRFADVRQLANRFLFEFHDAIANLAGSTPARQLVVATALAYLDSLAREAGDDPQLEEELAVAYQRVGDVQGLPHAANLGDTAGAGASYRQALAIRERLRTRGGGSRDNLRGMAILHARLGLLADVSGDTAAALAQFGEAVRIGEDLLQLAPDERGVRQELARASLLLGESLIATGDPAGALAEFRSALALGEHWAGEAPADAEAQRLIGQAQQRIGDVLENQGDWSGALASRRASLAIDERLAAASPHDARARRDLAISLGRLGNSLLAAGDVEGALREQRRALALREVLHGADPRNATYAEDLAIGHAKVADVLIVQRDLDGGLSHLRRALAMEEDLSRADPANARYRRGAGVYHYALARLHQSGGEVGEGLPEAEAALTGFRALAAGERASGRYRSEVAETLTLVGELQLALGRQTEAEASFVEARSLGELLVAEDATNLLNQAILAFAYGGLGGVASGRADLASSAAEQAAHWRDARGAYTRAQTIWSELERRGGLVGEDAARPAAVARALVRCDARLAALGERASPAPRP